MLTNWLYNRKLEIEEMSTFKRVAYSVGIVGAVIIAVLLLGGIWEPFAVQTSTTIPKKAG